MPYELVIFACFGRLQYEKNKNGEKGDIRMRKKNKKKKGKKKKKKGHGATSTDEGIRPGWIGIGRR